MSYAFMDQREVCRSKKAYTKKDAATARNFLEGKNGVKLRIYPCPYGNHWHLTHKKARR